MLRIPQCLIGCGGIIIVLLTMHAGAPMLTRGPYLQNGTTSSVVIRWRTDVPTEGHVRFGVSPSDLNRAVFDTSQTTNHEVIVAGLLPDSQYYYAIGSETETFAAGPDYFFITNPETAKPTRIWVLGDSGTWSNPQRAVRDAYYAFSADRHTDLWLMLGDNAYGEGTDAQYQGALFNIYPEMLRKSVLWPALGNVEGWYVEPDLRGKGIGRALIARAEAWAKQMGFTELASDAELENEESIRAHGALGFRETFRLVHFVKSLGEA